ncbi:MAG TPA: DUF2269 family protein [Magnetospirillum sp.]|nr:DUF2269 family protein [Magnetospirillum sp.]
MTLKTLHVVGVVLFIGNIIVTGWWKMAADLSRNPVVIAFAQRQVTITDWVFTLGGVTIVSVAGAGNALIHDIAFTTPWVLWGLVLFIASGVVWVAVLIPVQSKLTAITRTFTADSEIPVAYWRLEKLWIIFGTIATLLPLAAIPFMVFKAV